MEVTMRAVGFFVLIITMVSTTFAAAEDCSCKMQFAVYGGGDPVFFAGDKDNLGYSIVHADQIAVEGGDCLISQETVLGKAADVYYYFSVDGQSDELIAKIKYIDQDNLFEWLTLDEMNRVAIKACFGQLS